MLYILLIIIIVLLLIIVYRGRDKSLYYRNFFKGVANPEFPPVKEEIEKIVGKKPKTKILHIDDDKFILNMFKIKFEVNGNFEVTSMNELTNNFLDTIADLAPELIISDYIMPGLDGIEVLKAIKNDLRTKDIPFIFLTPDVFPKLLEEAKKYGAVGIINPGVTHPQEVVDEVTRILSNLKESL